MNKTRRNKARRRRAVAAAVQEMRGGIDRALGELGYKLDRARSVLAVSAATAKILLDGYVIYEEASEVPARVWESEYL